MANNLLDKSSIILTPTAYNNGEALCVKPSDGSGDFDFSRNSAATRVNAQGLVENVQILSSNLVQNGDFSEEGSEEVSNGSFSQEGVQLVTNGTFDSNIDFWNKGGGNFNPLSWDNGKIKVTNDVAQLNSARQTIATEIGKTYKISADVDSTNGITPRLASSNPTTAVIGTLGTIETLTYTFTATSTSSQIELFNWQNTIDKYNLWDNVSVREVGQDWDTFGTIDANNTVSFANNELTLRNDGSGSGVKQDALTIGKTYKIVVNVTDIVGNGFKVDMGNLQNITTTGTKTFYLTATTASLLLYRNSTSPQAVNGATITNISVKEVGQNWTLGSNIAIGENKLIGTNANSSTYQNVGIQANKKYKIQFTILDYSNGNVRFIINGSPNVVSSDVSSNGEHTLYINSNSNSNGYLSIQVFNNFNGSVTNISAVQISTDTSLPRINYEGFSYQDAFGSELLTDGAIINSGGGSFTFTPNGLIAISDGTSGTVARPILLWTTLTIGKQYRIVGTPTINSGNTNYSLYDGVAYVKNQVAVEAFDITFTCQGSSVFFTNDGTQTFDIDWNLSLKEVTGQEVVPDSGCGSWLWEPQSTNLITYSSDYTNGWINTGTTDVISSTMLSPNGLDYSTLLVGDVATASTKRIRNTVTPIASTAHTFSVFVKSANRTYIQIINSGDAQGYANFDVSNGIVGNTGSKTTANITSLNNNWYRCEVSTDATTINGGFMIYLVDSNTASFAASGTSTDGVYIWGAQLEQQSYATSYIPTNGEANGVTRNRDLCTNGGSLASINSTEGTLYAEIAALANSGTYRSVSLSDGTNANRVNLTYSTASNLLLGFINVNGVNTSFTFTVNPITDFVKCALKYKNNDCSLWVNGVEISNSTSQIAFPINTLTKLSFTSGSSSSNFFGKTKALAVFPYLSDAELTELTTI